MSATLLISNSGTATGTSVTVSLAVPSTASVIVACARTGAAITGVTFGGVAMTQAVIKDSSTQVYTGIYWLASPGAGTYDMVVSVGSSVALVGVVSAWSGCNGIAGTNSASGNSDAATVSATNTNQTAIDVCGIDSTATLTIGADQTSIYTGNLAGVSYENTTNSTMSWGISAAKYWASCVVWLSAYTGGSSMII